MQINDASGNGIICDFIAIVDQNEKQVETRHDRCGHHDILF